MSVMEQDQKWVEQWSLQDFATDGWPVGRVLVHDDSLSSVAQVAVKLVDCGIIEAVCFELV